MTSTSIPLSIRFRTSFQIILSSVILCVICISAIHWAGRLNIRKFLTIRPSQIPFSSLTNPTSNKTTSLIINTTSSSISIPPPLSSSLSNYNISIELLPTPLPIPELNQNSTRCIIYDRPPRTGSTTVFKYLDRCLSRRGYASSLKYFRGVPDHLLLDHLNVSPDKKRSLVSRHLTVFPSRSVTDLVANCSIILYITSARPIRSRLLSKLKYETPYADTNDSQVVGENGKVPLDMFQKLIDERTSDNTSVLEATEYYYEHYPGGTAVDFLVPDYVIRSQMFVTDFKALLKTLRCSTRFKSVNVHRVKELDDEERNQYLQSIPVTMNDTRYQTLMQHASRNERGLQKAALF